MTAPPAPAVMAKSGIGVSLWVTILLDKFLFLRPTCRLLKDLASHGLFLAQGTVTDGLARLLCLFEPIYDAFHARCLETDHWHADETRWPVFAPVEGKEGHRWNDYIDRYHYLGYTPLPRAQLRYFALARGQVLALLSFSASAWKVEPRDRFIGWTKEQRERNLPYVVNNSRFLILPWVRSKHLASRLLGLASRRVAGDWEARYAYRPVLLETFVEIERFAGTSYKAANWTCVGQTKGRGKLDVKHERGKPVKSVWLLPIDRRFRQILYT